MTNILGVVVFTGIILRHILKILFDFNRVIAGMVYPSNGVESSESQNIFDFYFVTRSCVFVLQELLEFKL